jgi:hypothetical protein
MPTGVREEKEVRIGMAPPGSIIFSSALEGLPVPPPRKIVLCPALERDGGGPGMFYYPRYYFRARRFLRFTKNMLAVAVSQW